MYVVMYQCLPLPRLLTLLPVDESLFSSLRLELFFMFLLVPIILSLFFIYFFVTFHTPAALPSSCLTFLFPVLFSVPFRTKMSLSSKQTAVNLPRGCNFVPRVLGSKIPNVSSLGSSFSNKAVAGQVSDVCLVWNCFFPVSKDKKLALGPENWLQSGFFAVPERTNHIRREWGYHDQTKTYNIADCKNFKTMKCKTWM